MKILANRFSGTYQKEILLNIIRGLGVKECVNIVPEPFKINDDEGRGCKFQHVFAYDVNAARYTQTDFNSLIPVDEALLKRMSFTECEIIRMLEKDIPSHTYFDQNEYPRDVIDPHVQFRINKYMLGSVVTMDYEERHRIYYRHVRFWNDFFTRNKIDFFVASYYPHYIYEYVAFRLAEIHRVPTVIASYTRVNQHCQIYNTIEENNPDIRQRYEQLLKTEKPENVKLNKYFQFEWDRMSAEEDKQTLPWYFNLEERKEIEEKAKDFYKERELAEESRKINTLRYQKKKDLKWLKNAIMRRVDVDFLYYRLKIGNAVKFVKRFQDYYESLCGVPDFKARYVYVPLHMQPEATTAPVGGAYADQSLMIQMLSYYLPEGWFLYVKENPWQKNKHRSVHFYQDLCNNPRVKLISKKVSTFQLQKYSVATATITGSAGLEGLFKNKPCLSFGYHYYMHAPGVFNIRTNEECKNALLKIHEGVNIDKGELLLFFKALQDCTVEASLSFENLVQSEYTYDENIKRLAEAYVSNIKKLLKLHDQ
ncbi:MAG: hypothetical protein ACOYXT_14055 [Bacteroidota bacterium]